MRRKSDKVDITCMYVFDNIELGYEADGNITDYIALYTRVVPYLTERWRFENVPAHYI